MTIAATAGLLLIVLAGCTDIPATPRPAGADEDDASTSTPSDDNQTGDPSTSNNRTMDAPDADNETAGPTTSRPYHLGTGDPSQWAVDGSLPGLPPSAASGSSGGGSDTGPGSSGDGASGGAASSQPNGSVSDTTRVDACSGPAADPTYANAWGLGSAVVVRETIVDVADVTLLEVEAAQSGPGQKEASGNDSQIEASDVTGTFSHIVRADVAQVQSWSNVSNVSMDSTQRTVAELTNVDILDGLVTADVLRAVATTRANATSGEWSSDGSMLEGVRVNGTFTETSKPWFTLDVSDQFGPGSTISLYETIGHVHTPVKPVDGFAADLKVNLMHVNLHDIAADVDGDQSVSIVISQAHSHSDFPEDPGCRPVQGVHGHAYNVHGTGEVPGHPATYGFATIPRTGGSEERHVGHIEVGGNSGSAINSSIEGDTDAGRSWTRSVSEVADVCLLETAAGCTVSATTVRVVAEAEALSTGEKSRNASTVIQDLKIAGVDACPVFDAEGICRPEPNTQIPLPGGLGVLVLNEQLAMPSDTPECHIGVKVRGVHVEPSPLNARAVVSEAEAAAFYCPDPASLP